VRRLFRSVVLAFGSCLLVASTGCSSAAVRYAERGDLVGLRREIDPRHARGKLDDGEARDIAKALLGHEIAGFSGESGPSRVESLRACVRDLEGPLESRADRHDPTGATAAKLLLEEGVHSASSASRYEDDADPAYRGLAARALVDDDEAALRAAALLSPELVSREMAALAAGDGATLGELDALFEVARLDPDARVKHLALRAAVDAVGRKKKAVLEGLTPGADDDERAATRSAQVALDRLRDAWTTGDKGLRDDVASGFATSPFYELGGREALRARLGEGGADRLVLVSALLRGDASRTEAEDRFLRENAARIALSALRDGSTLERKFAVILVRPEGEALDALKKVSTDADRDLAVSALGKLLFVPAEADRARVELVRIAGNKDDLVLAPRARGILAGSRYLPVQLWLEEQAARKEPGLKLRAAAGLAALGRVARAAPLFVDPDPDVRSRAACIVLAATR
jgi:hypothetical protein